MYVISDVYSPNDYIAGDLIMVLELTPKEAKKALKWQVELLEPVREKTQAIVAHVALFWPFRKCFKLVSTGDVSFNDLEGAGFDWNNDPVLFKQLPKGLSDSDVYLDTHLLLVSPHSITARAYTKYGGIMIESWDLLDIMQELAAKEAKC